MKEEAPIVLDPLIHEVARLVIVSVLNECGAASFNFLLGTTGLTRGNLSAHMIRLVTAGYVEEKKQIRDRKMLTEYSLSSVGRKAFADYRREWTRLTQGNASLR
ncbi:transcriptional regulator [Telmatocola sphagniphila]|uniref:Transcriptional regulator n=1 Tax=Telmatocola sphagniphila TaxID=1123043 RepID=A0A8E6B8K5_9BACT|nr:transcriptional regulator [Telmatocola sphagniphila]QVL33751.1 transcriptional regulator [Telmatocola sphagniphila]